jgi:hypothetical protein
MLLPGVAPLEMYKLCKNRGYSREDTSGFMTGAIAYELCKIVICTGMTYRIAEALGNLSVKYF